MPASSSDILGILKNHGVNMIRCDRVPRRPMELLRKPGAQQSLLPETDAQDLDLAKRARTWG